jgi:hypothetical protein
MANLEPHWQKVWTSKAPDQVSWFEQDPVT